MVTVERSPLRRYGVALATVAAALVAKLLVDPALGAESPFLVFISAVTVSAWYGGIGPGLVATVGSCALSAYVFFPPFYSVVIDDPDVRMRIAVFALEGTLVSVVTEAMHRARRRVETRRRSSEILAEVGRALSETMDQQLVAQRIVDGVRDLLHARNAAVYRLELPSHDLYSVAISGDMGPAFGPRIVLVAGTGVAGAAVREGRVVASPNLLTDPRIQLSPESRARIELATHRATLGVPLRAKGAVIGALSVGDAEGRAYTPDERDLAQAFADQAAVAMENAQRFADEHMQRGALAALLDVHAQIGADVPTERVLASIAETAMRLLEVDNGGFRLVDGDELVTAGLAGTAPETMSRSRLKIGESFSGRVVAEGRTLRGPADRWQVLPEHRVPADRLGYTHHLGVPLRVGERIIGVFAFRARRPFSLRDERLAEVFANQAAIAIEKARLAQQMREQAERMAALAAFGRVLSSTLDPMRVGQEAADSIRALLGARASALYRLDLSTGDLVAVAVSGAVRETLRPGAIFPQGTGVIGLALRDGAPVATPDVFDDPRITLSPDIRRGIADAGYRAVLAVPLVVRDQLIGALGVGDVLGRAFTAEDVRVAQAFADHAALSIENARLYADVEAKLQQLETTQAQLLQAGKLAAVGQLVSGVAHELNNPLMVVAGEAELLARLGDDGRLAERVRAIHRGAMRAAHIVRELQTFVRPQPRAIAPLDVSAVVERVVALRAEGLRVGGITLVREIAPGLPKVMGDATQLEQVVLNLLLNAEQAVRDTAEPRITVRLGAALQRVALVVADSGPGIAADVLPRVFEPFFTTKAVGEGTGLGLSICYSIVQAHAGRITADSVPGRGAVFTVELPVAVAAEPPASGALPPPGSAPAPLPALRPGRVLVVEDEEPVAIVMKDMLAELGQQATIARDIATAWKLLASDAGGYDVVTLDVRMPAGSGKDLFARLTRDLPVMAKRVIFVTGDTADAETQRFLTLTERPVLMKPVGFDTLAAVLTPLLGA